MRKFLRFSAVLFTALIFSFTSFAQEITINGTVSSNLTLTGVASVSVIVKGGTQGTTTDAAGSFRLTVPALPVKCHSFNKLALLN